ncbi:ATP-binding protein [Vibrio cholerae]|uniref:RNA-binding domain-containing protein n=1 Tax=Vibrio anguillarum TaxID=55601 RepID=UPI003CFAF385|nr:ATP-binding protein [Vibrio cholerae]
MKNKSLSLIKLLELNIDKISRKVSNRESEHREFKLKYENNNLPKFAKTMAAFANRDGGVLFFGIKDRPRELVGIVESEFPDDVVITNFLKEYFQPEILYESHIIDFCSHKVHALLVSPSNRKPVICKKSKSIKLEHGKPEKEVLREGAIYYRYSASTDEIKYADLILMLDREREVYFRSMIDNITLLNKVGVDKAAVVDAHELAGNDQAASVYLTNDTAQNLNWIERGKFVEDESEGGKAYYVVRKVEIKHGVEIQKPVDFAKTHPLTKTDLKNKVKINGVIFDAVIWKLGIKDNPIYHISSNHGKNPIHKFTEASVQFILKHYPKDLKNRKEVLKKVYEEYSSALR